MSLSDEALKKAFSSWDQNGDGFIVPSEVRAVLSGAGVPPAQLDKMTNDVISKIDTNSDGKISFEEFKHAMLSGVNLFKKS